MSKIPTTHFWIIFLLLGLIYGASVKIQALPYDYSFTDKCLENPQAPQYGGGIITNPELDQGLEGWTTFGDAAVNLQESNNGNKFIVASSRKQHFHSFAQKFYLHKEKLYTFSAWLQVSDGEAHIAAMFKTKGSYETAGWVTARKGCWSMLKGGLVVNVSGPAQLYFQSHNTDVDIWADSISLQPFTHEEWTSHQQQNVDKVRKKTVKIKVVNEHKRPLRNATISIKPTRSGFPVGCAINKNLLQNSAYQNWFASRFKYTVFENELKWYTNEPKRGVEDYSAADGLLGFAQSHGIAVRGHNVFWDNPSDQPWWVGGLSPNDLWGAANTRINSVMSRYRGKLFHWDVVNENLHFSFFESKLGGSASTTFYEKANSIDSSTYPFLNEYNTIEQSGDGNSSPVKYLQKIRDMRNQGYHGPLGIGLQGHFSDLNLPYIRSALDTLASANLPMWITELDVKAGPNQAGYLGQILNEIHSHGAVKGIMFWSAWSPQGCYAMCLTDNNFRNLPTGDVVDGFMRSQLNHVEETTDVNGFFEARLFHGEYEMEINHPTLGLGGKSSKPVKFSVLSDEEEEEGTAKQLEIHL